eukprot:scaffold252761_cov22-Tisochrysis_lutea.AAC.5
MKAALPPSSAFTCMSTSRAATGGPAGYRGRKLWLKRGRVVQAELDGRDEECDGAPPTQLVSWLFALRPSLAVMQLDKGWPIPSFYTYLNVSIRQ